MQTYVYDVYRLSLRMTDVIVSVKEFPVCIMHIFHHMCIKYVNESGAISKQFQKTFWGCFGVLLYPPREWSEPGEYTVFTFVCVSVRPSVCVHSVVRRKYLQNGLRQRQLPTNRKWPMVDRMMTSSMTSRDLERSRS